MDAPDVEHCLICGSSTALVSIADAAATLVVPVETIRRWQEARQIHIRCGPGREVLVCVRSLALRAIRRPPSHDLRVERILDEIQEKFSQSDLKMNALARSFHISRWHLARRFKKEAGIGFKKYLTLVRALKAAELLRETPLSVKEIAARVGFKHVSDFNHQFRLIFRASPRQYRGPS